MLLLVCELESYFMQSCRIYCSGFSEDLGCLNLIFGKVFFLGIGFKADGFLYVLMCIKAMACSC